MLFNLLTKKGSSDPNEQGVYDYYVDNKNMAKDYTIDSQIKFPIENNGLNSQILQMNITNYYK